MKLQKIKSAFTLIELLVVITIIGILATWAVNVYTSQIQKSRDAVRVTDLNALRTWLEQMYQQNGTYPNTWIAWTTLPSFLGIKTYVPKLPVDPKTWQKSTNANFDYAYAVAWDVNGIRWQLFEVSAHFENDGNTQSKSRTDGWSDGWRLELGMSLDTIGTALNNTTNAVSWVNLATIAWTSCSAMVAWTNTALPAALAAWAASAVPVACGTTESTTTANIQTLTIR